MWGLASDPGKTGADGAKMGGERGVGLEREGISALADAPPAEPVGVRGYQPRLWSKSSSRTGSAPGPSARTHENFWDPRLCNALPTPVTLEVRTDCWDA